MGGERPVVPSASDLPDEAFGAALAGLDAMTPRRLWLLARSATSLRALWQAIVDGRPGEHAALAHLVREAPELVGTWARSAARVDPGALGGGAPSVLTTPFVSGRPGYLKVSPRTRSRLAFSSPRPARRVGLAGGGHHRHPPRDRRRDGDRGGARQGAGRGRHRGGLGPGQGIDGAAHRGALSAEARPADRRGRQRTRHVSPRCNAGLWDEVGRRGLLCAEVPPARPRPPTGSPPATASLPHSPTWSSWSSRGSAVAHC